MPEPESSIRPDLLRPLDRRAFLRSSLAVSAGGAALYAVGCSSGDDGENTPAPTRSSSTAAVTPATTANPSGITPNLLTAEFVANRDNRFAVGLIGKDNKLVTGAEVHLKFFTVGADGTTGTFRGEGDALYVELNVPGAHAHDSTTGDLAADDSVAFYVANTPFDQAGQWGVEIDATLTDGSYSFDPGSVHGARTVAEPGHRHDATGQPERYLRHEPGSSRASARARRRARCTTK